jgi:hypothetical protein
MYLYRPSAKIPQGNDRLLRRITYFSPCSGENEVVSNGTRIFLIVKMCANSLTKIKNAFFSIFNSEQNTCYVNDFVEQYCMCFEFAMPIQYVCRRYDFNYSRRNCALFVM